MIMCVQVAFDMDPRQTYSDELGLKNVRGDGTLRFVIAHALEAVHNSFFKPYMRVRPLEYCI